jgi:hydrogenase maturation factor
MCITRVGKVLSIENSKAKVELVGDSRIVENVDVSMISARKNSYVELYANLAVGLLNSQEANARKRAWTEVMRAGS